MKPSIATVLLGATLSAAPCLAQLPNHRGGHAHGSLSAEEWVRILENPGRDEWQKPVRVVAALHLEKGDSAADIGAGSGYFSARFAEAVGPEGRVYAVDIDQGLIDHLAQRADKEGLENLTPVLGAPDDPRLDPASIDLIFICDVVHHIENRQDYYKKLAAALRPGGRLAIVDFYKRETPVGPPVAMKIAKSAMIDELRQAGFELAEDIEFLPHQYFLIFTPGGNR